MIISNESMAFNDPKELNEPQLFDDPQRFDIQLEVWTLIIQKSSVIPPSSIVLFWTNIHPWALVDFFLVPRETHYF